MLWLVCPASAILGPLLVFLAQFILAIVLKPLQRLLGDAEVVGFAALLAALVVASTIGGIAAGLRVPEWPGLVLWFAVQLFVDLSGVLAAGRRDPDYQGEASSLTGLNITISLGHAAGLIAYFVS